MTTPNAQPVNVEITTTITLGKAQVPVTVLLFSAGYMGEPDRFGRHEPVAVGRVTSVGYWSEGGERQHHVVNGVPIRFDANVENTDHGLRVSYLSAYRGDKDYGLADITDTVRSQIWKAAPALVASVLADPALAHAAEVAKAERAVEYAQRDLDKAREVAHKAAEAVAKAEAALAGLKGAQASV